MKYDYLIVGAGLAGAVFAHFATREGKRCLVVEKKANIGGMCHTENVDGIIVHKFGAHIFHTNRKEIWDFVNGIVEFEPFVNTPIANYQNRVFNMPINMNTFNQLWGVITPYEAKKRLQSQIVSNDSPKNLEEWVLANVGSDIYKYLIKDYTEKQWGKSCTELPPDIMRRIPIRYTYNNNYFNDLYQGIPKNGYTDFIRKLMSGSDFQLEIDYFYDKEYFDRKADKVVYTGAIDRFFNYEFGALEWRSVRFDEHVYYTDNFQGVAVVNHTDLMPYTRTIEHRHFQHKCTSEKTIVSYEYPCVNAENPCYPVPTAENINLYSKYKAQIDTSKYIMLGRLAEYKYYDMNVIIENIYDKYKETDD